MEFKTTPTAARNSPIPENPLSQLSEKGCASGNTASIAMTPGRESAFLEESSLFSTNQSGNPWGFFTSRRTTSPFPSADETGEKAINPWFSHSKLSPPPTNNDSFQEREIANMTDPTSEISALSVDHTQSRHDALLVQEGKEELLQKLLDTMFNYPKINETMAGLQVLNIIDPTSVNASFWSNNREISKCRELLLNRSQVPLLISQGNDLPAQEVIPTIIPVGVKVSGLDGTEYEVPWRVPFPSENKEIRSLIKNALNFYYGEEVTKKISGHFLSDRNQSNPVVLKDIYLLWDKLGNESQESLEEEKKKNILISNFSEKCLELFSSAEVLKEIGMRPELLDSKKLQACFDEACQQTSYRYDLGVIFSKSLELVVRSSIIPLAPPIVLCNDIIRGFNIYYEEREMEYIIFPIACLLNSVSSVYFIFTYTSFFKLPNKCINIFILLFASFLGIEFNRRSTHVGNDIDNFRSMIYYFAFLTSLFSIDESPESIDENIFLIKSAFLFLAFLFGILVEPTIISRDLEYRSLLLTSMDYCGVSEVIETIKEKIRDFCQPIGKREAFLKLLEEDDNHDGDRRQKVLQLFSQMQELPQEPTLEALKDYLMGIFEKIKEERQKMISSMRVSSSIPNFHPNANSFEEERGKGDLEEGKGPSTEMTPLTESYYPQYA